ncbi:MAG TPA: flavin reductase [Pyrinomonadaceae bacterium]|nr:flavin reductase [Pyrinomonadaceae bacterium]
MHWPGRTIWDTRVQGICGILSAQGEDEIALFVSATFAQVSLNPPRVVINPNRTYSIDSAISRTGRFAINVMPASRQEQIIRLMSARRRQPNRAEVVGLQMRADEHEIPFVDGALQTLFCAVESSIDAGDRKLYVATILESRSNSTGELPLLFSAVSGGPRRYVKLQKGVRSIAARSGALDILKKGYHRLRPPAPPDIAMNTYEEAGATESEIATIESYGLLDQSKKLSPPPAPALVKKSLGVCVVGTGWGSFHCNLLREVNSAAKLFVCGRNPEKTARLAKAVKADDFFLGLDQAVADPRVQALIVALPHDLHRSAAEQIAAAGKHALIEKPIATNLADADAMILAARQAGTILMIAEDMHFRPAINEAVKRIFAGEIGEPLYFFGHAAGVRRPRGWAAQAERMGGGVLMDMGVHYVRALRLLLGEPESVIASRAMQVDTKISGEDNVQLIFSNSVGWDAHLILSWASARGHLPDIIVAGEKGTIHLWPGTSYIDLYPQDPPLIPRMLSLVRPYWLQEKLMRPHFARVRVSLPGKEASGYQGEVREFLAAVAEDREPASPAEDARRDLEIVLSAYEALAQKQRLAVPQVKS